MHRFAVVDLVLGRDQPGIGDHIIGTAQVNDLLAARSRQTAHDRIKDDTLLAGRDQGHWRLPTWQFDPDGPDGVIDGLPEVLKALQLSDLAKIRWLQRPQPLKAH